MVAEIDAGLVRELERTGELGLLDVHHGDFVTENTTREDHVIGVKRTILFAT